MKAKTVNLRPKLKCGGGIICKSSGLQVISTNEMSTEIMIFHNLYNSTEIMTTEKDFQLS